METQASLMLEQKMSNLSIREISKLSTEEAAKLPIWKETE